MDLKTDIGIRITQFRNKKRISQEEFAHSANIDRTYVARMESEMGNVIIIALQQIIMALETNYHKLLDHSIFRNGEE